MRVVESYWCCKGVLLMEAIEKALLPGSAMLTMFEHVEPVIFVAAPRKGTDELSANAPRTYSARGVTAVADQSATTAPMGGYCEVVGYPGGVVRLEDD